MRDFQTRLFISIIVSGIAFIAYSLCDTWSLMQAHILQMIDQQNRLSLEFNLAYRDYVDNVVRPETSRRFDENEFCPETMSTALVARFISRITTEMPYVVFKFSSENPRNPLNRATPEETEIIRNFKDHPGDTTWAGLLSLEGKKYYVRANARRMERKCLRCHGRPEDAPAAVLEKYGRTAGFGRAVGDVSLNLVAFQAEKAAARFAPEMRKRILLSLGALLLFLGGIGFFIRKYAAARSLAEEAVTREFTELRRVEAALRETELLLSEAQHLAHLGTWTYNPETECFSWSDEIYRILGLPPGRPMNFGEFVQYVEPEDYKALVRGWSSVSEKNPSAEFEYRIMRPSGEMRHIHEYCIYRFDAGSHACSAAGLILDITERKQAEALIRHMATHDVLTDLPGLRLARDRLSMALSLARRQNSVVAVMLIDLNDFKAVNDTLGHNAGNFVLKQVAGRLLSFKRETDTVARIGGDEFIYIATGLRVPENAALIADKLIKRVVQPIVFKGQQAGVGASIGIALYPDHGRDMDRLMKLADDAMYEIKKSGKSGYAFAAPEQ